MSTYYVQGATLGYNPKHKKNHFALMEITVYRKKWTLIK